MSKANNGGAKETGALATVLVQDNLPDFLRGMVGDSRGSEEVEASDLVIPRIELVQSLSKARKKGDAAHIPGAEEGALYNSVTRKLYGDEILVCPVYFRKEWLLWRDQDLGGGFAGSYNSEEEARGALATQDKPEEWEVVDTYQHFVLVLNADGTSEEAAISMSKTKAKVSRNWNSLVRINGGPRFSRVYRLSGVSAQNAAGQDYYTLQVANAGFPSEQVFRTAEKVYELVSSGRASVSTDYDEDTDATHSDM